MFGCLGIPLDLAVLLVVAAVLGSFLLSGLSGIALVVVLSSESVRTRVRSDGRAIG